MAYLTPSPQRLTDEQVRALANAIRKGSADLKSAIAAGDNGRETENLAMPLMRMAEALQEAAEALGRIADN